MDGLSNSDVALLSDRDGMGSGFFWVFALLLLAGGGFNGGFGNGMRGDYVSQADLAASQNAQTQQMQLNTLGVQVANQNFELAQLMTAQNNANMVNAIQGFNALSQQLAGLGAQMNECCCSIKTQMLQDRLADTQAKLTVAQNAIDNANQSQYILGQLGRFVAWAGSGAPAATTSGN